MSYPYYKRTDAGTAPSPSFNLFKTVFGDRTIDGTEIVSLLESPSVSNKLQWKIRSFLHVERKLRPKLDKYSAAALISVFGKHLDVTNHVANNKADSHVT